MLRNRNLTKEQVHRLLNPSIDSIGDIQNFQSMNEGIRMFDEHIKKNNKIGILVDVDIDGYTSAAIVYIFLHRYLKHKNIEVLFHDNSKEHGLQEDIMNKAIDSKVSLLIVPDAASEDYEQHRILNEREIDLLILDHHNFDRDKIIGKNTVVINNKDANIENKFSSGCAVTYKFIEHYAEVNDIDLENMFIDLVGFSTISDSCDMRVEENRYYYMQGSQVTNITNSLLKFMVSKAYIKDSKSVTIGDMSFKINPKLNALIRRGNLEERELLFKCFINDSEDLNKLAFKLMNSYKKEQDTEKYAGVDEIMRMIEIQELHKNPILLVNCTNLLEKNILGLVAGQLLNGINRPIMLYTEEEGVCQGSFRNKGNNDIANLSKFCKDSNLFEWVRGHDNAAGFRIAKDNLDKFITYTIEKVDPKLDFSAYIVEDIYEGGVIKEDVLSISKLEDLWAANLEAPKYLVLGVEIDTERINRPGDRSAYNFMHNGVKYNKSMCSNEWIEGFVHSEFKNRDKNIKANMIVEFRKDRYGNSTVNIVDAKTYVID